MFPSLGVQNSTSYFKNLMEGYGGQAQWLRNQGYLLDTSEGALLAVNQTLSVQNIKATIERAVGIQFWFKGSLTDTYQLVALRKNSTVDFARITRNGNDVVIRSSYTAATATLSYAASSNSPTKWTLIGLTVGWMTTADQFIL